MESPHESEFIPNYDKGGKLVGEPRELLVELIGGELTAQYFEGIPIEIEEKTIKYIIKRRREHIDVVRYGDVAPGFVGSWGGRIHKSLSSESYKQNPHYEVREIPMELRGKGLEDHSWQFRLIGTSSIRKNVGCLHADNLDDAVVAFIQSAKLGKVDWKCGNIDVVLPMKMPLEQEVKIV